MAPAKGLEVRNPNFELNSEIPRFWHGGRRSVTLFFNNLSIFFPHGERFFIASVKAYAARVSDPSLQANVRGFCGQEAMHSGQHVRYNELLARQGYPIKAMERGVEKLLARTARKSRRRVHLSVTCALEHFTAIMAHLLLSDPRLLEGAHPTMAALWRWHATEESEHKAVAFDVYRLTSASYWERASVMLFTAPIFWAKVIEHQIRLMAADRILFSAREWASLIRFLFIEPGGMLLLMRLYLHYYKPGFHPSDLDSDVPLADREAELWT